MKQFPNVYSSWVSQYRPKNEPGNIVPLVKYLFVEYAVVYDEYLSYKFRVDLNDLVLAFLDMERFKQFRKLREGAKVQTEEDYYKELRRIGHIPKASVAKVSKNKGVKEELSSEKLEEIWQTQK